MSNFKANFPNLRERVDYFLRVEKTSVGIPEWKKTNYQGQYRWMTVIAIEDQPTDIKLIIDAYPDESYLKFTINLLYTIYTNDILVTKSVMRLDYGDHERHRNHNVKKILLPEMLEIGWIYGSHLHPWSMNRVLATNSKIPDILEFAQKIPDRIKNFEQAFRFFCASARIIIEQEIFPSLPKRDRLL